MLTIGIDVGTSTVSGVVYDTETEEVKASVTVPGSQYLPTEVPGGAEQSTGLLLTAVREVLEALEQRAPGAGAIAFSTQMHGMVYIDRDLHPLSPLITWEDKRADRPAAEGGGSAGAAAGGLSLAEQITDLTGYPTATGYALATHVYNMRHGLVPEGVWKMVTAGDYCAMRLCKGGGPASGAAGVRGPVMHPQTAASFGLFSVYEGCFDEIALDILDITDVILPEVGEYGLAGYTKDGKAVFFSMGDNQAGFTGAAGEPGDILINVGTSAQISAVLETHGRSVSIARELDLRPYIGSRFLVTGAALAGGSVLRSLNTFLIDVIHSVAPDLRIGADELYGLMDRLAEEAYGAGRAARVDTRFSGTRIDPELRGSITGIGMDGLNLGSLCAGFYYGIVKELYDFYCLMPREIREQARRVILTGNAARKNPILRRIAEDLFGMETVVSPRTEDAAVGAARYAAMCMEHTRE